MRGERYRGEGVRTEGRLTRTAGALFEGSGGVGYRGEVEGVLLFRV